MANIFRTTLSAGEFSSSFAPIRYSEKILLLGSCFAENMGERLRKLGYSLCANPFGICYNPASMSRLICRLAENRPYTAAELLQDERRGLWQSFDHHSRFSRPTLADTLDTINTHYLEGTKYYTEADTWLLTLGTAWVYALSGDSARIVNNCHHQPAAAFERRRMSVNEVADCLYTAIAPALQARPNLRILLTVSPIRHLKDGFHDNQLSKSTLLLAIEELRQRFDGERLHYFPAYELLLDDLRDYRFFADDMLHPAPLAVDYIWQHFERHALSSEQQPLREQMQQLQQAAQHRPFNPDTPAHQKFVKNQLQQINNLLRQNLFDFRCLEELKMVFERQII